LSILTSSVGSGDASSPTPRFTLLDAARSAAGAQQYPAGALYVVATPIGNLADLTLRAVHTLALADTVACEDTRHTVHLLRHLGLDKPLLALHAHNETAVSLQVIERLRSGQRVALVSDAGTPAISDPGAALVAAVAQQGLRAIPIPGPSSATTAASVAGDVAAEGFVFRGFLPAKGAERVRMLERCTADASMQLLFEAPHRIDALLDSLARAQPQRRITICRELTKQFETVCTMTAAQAPGWLAADAQQRRGEFVLVLHAQARTATSRDEGPGIEALRVLDLLLAQLPLKQAVGLAASISGAPRKALYTAALARREADAPPIED
jgi:16S rRNA (cytidine1402-2'-O)-methyltransferase